MNEEGRRILIVDDDRDFSAMIAEYLRDRGHAILDELDVWLLADGTQTCSSWPRQNERPKAAVVPWRPWLVGLPVLPGG